MDNKIASAKLTYICYSIDGKVKCKHCTGCLIPNNSKDYFNFNVSFPQFDKDINIQYSIEQFYEMSAEEIIKDIIEKVTDKMIKVFILF